MQMERGSHSPTGPGWRRRWGPAEKRIVEQGIAKLAREDAGAAASMRSQLARACARADLKRLAVDLAQALSGDRYRRHLNRDQFPSDCPICGREISPFEIVAEDRRTGAVLHSACAPRPTGALTVSEPASALEWLAAQLN